MKKLFLIFALVFSFTAFAQTTHIFERGNVKYEFTVKYGTANTHDTVLYSIKENGNLLSVGIVPLEDSTEPGFIRFEKIDVNLEGVIFIELRSYNEYQFYIEDAELVSRCILEYEEPDPTISIVCVMSPCPTAMRTVYKTEPCRVNVPVNFPGKTIIEKDTKISGFEPLVSQANN